MKKIRSVFIGLMAFTAIQTSSFATSLNYALHIQGPAYDELIAVAADDDGRSPASKQDQYGPCQ
jgi:hypothetical protein